MAHLHISSEFYCREFTDDFWAASVLCFASQIWPIRCRHAFGMRNSGLPRKSISPKLLFNNS
jgi:hypothetical protein